MLRRADTGEAAPAPASVEETTEGTITVDASLGAVVDNPVSVIAIERDMAKFP